jgi:hypothetical protein
MTNMPFGGDGMPFSPERAKVVESPAMENTDHCLSKENPSGFEESQKSGAATNMVCHARNPEDTSPELANELLTVPKSSEGEEKEDLEESESGMAEMAKKHDGTGDDASLASGGEKAVFSSFMMSSETIVPPCHQTIGKQCQGNVFG